MPAPIGRSLWLAAIWTGAGVVFVAAVLAIVVVAILWLPAAGPAGSAGSAIKAGILTVLAAEHGGITVDGVSANFVPLGLTIALGGLAYRAGSGLADVADDLGERRPARLLKAALLQVTTAALVSVVLAAVSTLGTSHAPAVGTLLLGFVFFAVTSGAGFVRWSALSDEVTERVPVSTVGLLRGALAFVAVQLTVGALLVAGSLVMHHGRVAALSAQVGGGLAGVPVLLLGLLAAPNAAIAGSAYLAGPGFSVGSDTAVRLTTSAHGLIPAFPVLGAVPSGPGGPTAWLLAVLGPLAGGLAAARAAGGTDRRWYVTAGRLGALVALLGVVLAWQGGGSAGDGRLATVGASPWLYGFATGMLAVLGTATGFGLRALAAARSRHGAVLHPRSEPVRSPTVRAVAERVAPTRVVEVDEADGGVRGTFRSVVAAVRVQPEERDDPPRRAG